MKKMILLSIIFYAMQSSAQQIFPLYEGEIPNSKPAADEEKSYINNDSILIIEAVQKPTITVYLPEKTKANGTGVVICPGGGYWILAASHEGKDIAKAFNEFGVTAFVLNYRIPNDKWMKDKTIGPLQDAQRAIQFVRQNAAKYNIDTSKIGIMGFSAGGHLASTAATHFSKAYIDNPLGTNLRPDFQILIYPVISFEDSIGHIGSRDQLLGKNATKEMVSLFSNEQQVNTDTPPAFLVHASDDDAVKVANTIHYYETLIRNKVPAEMHIYEKGGHGFGLNNKTTNDKWMERLHNWMQSKGLVK